MACRALKTGKVSLVCSIKIKGKVLPSGRPDDLIQCINSTFFPCFGNRPGSLLAENSSTLTRSSFCAFRNHVPRLQGEVQFRLIVKFEQTVLDAIRGRLAPSELANDAKTLVKEFVNNTVFGLN